MRLTTAPAFAGPKPRPSRPTRRDDVAQQQRAAVGAFEDGGKDPPRRRRARGLPSVRRGRGSARRSAVRGRGRGAWPDLPKVFHPTGPTGGLRAKRQRANRVLQSDRGGTSHKSSSVAPDSRKAQILRDRRGEQMWGLPQQNDAPPDGSAGKPFQRDAAEADSRLARIAEANEEIGKAGFPRAARADKGDARALLDQKINPSEGRTTSSG